ncbi:MerR family transcriptional regulator [Clostridium paraputrificum]|uniref:MerR family transcriptional regulator n=1 Tax=Clostridium TaxID=1485 RepID=UPI003D337000
MTIKEAEERTGISKQNIRFYEKAGLISPYHNKDNGYRIYSEEDITLLNEIKLFRKLGVSIEDILRMQKNEISIASCMKKYSQIAVSKIDELKKQKSYFDRIGDLTAEGNEIDLTKYLNELEEEEKKGTKFFNIAFDFITKAKNYLGKGIGELFVKKGFLIELDEALTYPSAVEVCKAIKKDSDSSGQELKFVSEEKPVTFYLNGVLYNTEITTARGGYVLHCKEV